MKTKIMATALLATIALATAPVLAKWSYTDWGMTAEQVAAASAGKIKVVADDPDKRVFELPRYAAGIENVGGTAFESEFFFNKDKLLTLVSLTPDMPEDKQVKMPDATCDALVKDYSAQMDKPATVNKDLGQAGKPLVMGTIDGVSKANGDKMRILDVAAPHAGIRMCKVMFSPASFDLHRKG